MEKRVKAREYLQIGRCDVIYQSHTGIEKVYKDVAVCDVEIKKGEFMRVVYFTIPQDSKIIGYMQ